MQQIAERDGQSDGSTMSAWLVDAFTSAPLRGGPAFVIEPFCEWPADAQMQAIAAELAQPETAFLRRTAGSDRFGIRWFTPTAEAPLCGHATLAAAHVLFAEEAAGATSLTFDSLGGTLSARKLGTSYELDFPADAPRRIGAPRGLAQALGGRTAEVWCGRQYLCAVLGCEEDVRSFVPDLGAIAAVSNEQGYEKGSLVITAAAEPAKPYDAVSRFFAPLFGIPEDPVTGSAHCMLAPLYAGKTGQRRLRFAQAYPGRGAELECELLADRVLLRGSAVTVVSGSISPLLTGLGLT